MDLENILKINVEEAGIRLDNYLTDKLNFSRSKIQKMIEDGYILVNDKIVKSSYKIQNNDVITVNDDYNVDVDIKAENIPLDIVYEDDDIIVVNKKSGMVVHPAPGNYTNTLVNALMYHTSNLSKVNTNIRPGIVHRIDADTSGLLVVAKNDDAHNFLAEQLKDHKFTRKYIALVNGVIKEDTATIDAPIGRDEIGRKKMCVTSKNSKEAITHIKVLKRFRTSTLIECVLETGRTHQIRVHLSYIGHPLVNDKVYGSRNQDDPSFGQMLHAKTLGFIHPNTKEYMEFSVDAPKEFNEILNNYSNLE